MGAMIQRVRIEDFDPDLPRPPGKDAFFLEISPSTGGQRLGFPLLLATGRGQGKTLVAIAGVHGDEYEGVQAIHEIYHQLNPDEMSGRLLAVPVANQPAHWAVSRHTPIDFLNLARIFPGRREGTFTERLAYYLSEKIISCADFFVDLHSAGIKYLIPPMVGYGIGESARARVSKEAAQIFGTPVVWGHPGEVPPGRTISEADRRSISWVYVEASGGGRIRPAELPYYKNGLLNLLKYLKIIPGQLEAGQVKYQLVGKGDLDEAISSNTAGFFVPMVQILERVARKQVVGFVRDLFGETIEEIRSQQEGFVIVLRALPIVYPGETVCVITGGSALC
jgi:predicted deacylase